MAPSQNISGITVPHHLVAADLVARAFRLIEGGEFDKVVILSPDHFKRATRPFATTRRHFETIYGRVITQRGDVDHLLKSPDLIEPSDLFEKEHGVAAVLPFLKHALPDAAIVPIAISLSSRRSDWDRLVARLSPMIGPRTLIVQSTDFSHYLPFAEAARRDQETLNVIASGNLDAVAILNQPQHLDSRGAEYIQLRLQRERFRAEPQVLFNSNMQAYSAAREEQTTSYIVQVFARADAQQVGTDLPGSKVYCFAGDTFFGRSIAQQLGNPDVAARLRTDLKAVLNGCRLILNLEGVVTSVVPSGLGPTRLAMPTSLTADWLAAHNVVAVSLANNHAMDLGARAFDAMARELQARGITVLRHGDVTDLGPFRLVALTDLDNSRHLLNGAVTDGDLARLMQSGQRLPLFAFMHWGSEFDAQPSERENALAEALRRAAVSLIVGAHPHVASARLDLVSGGKAITAFSLGNFLFDQSSRRASGALLEVRLFDQGTFAARLVPIANFLENARGAAARRENH